MNEIIFSDVELRSAGCRRTIVAAPPGVVRIDLILPSGTLGVNPIIVQRSDTQMALQAIARTRMRGRTPVGHIKREDGKRWALVAQAARDQHHPAALLCLLEDANGEPLKGRAVIAGDELRALERACVAVKDGAP